MVIHPKQYSDTIEEKVINECFWEISSINETMTSDRKIQSSDNFYQLFYPIFSETPLKTECEFVDYKIYLINFSSSDKNIQISSSKNSRIIYFVNNSNAKLFVKNESIDMSDKRGKSFYIDQNDDILLLKSNNIQSCIVILELNKFVKINKVVNYR